MLRPLSSPKVSKTQRRWGVMRVSLLIDWSTTRGRERRNPAACSNLLSLLQSSITAAVLSVDTGPWIQMATWCLVRTRLVQYCNKYFDQKNLTCCRQMHSGCVLRRWRRLGRGCSWHLVSSATARSRCASQTNRELERELAPGHAQTDAKPVANFS